jgi:hypothetical protein
MSYYRRKVLSISDAVKEFGLHREQVRYAIVKCNVQPVTPYGKDHHCKWYPRNRLITALRATYLRLLTRAS